MFLVIYGPNEDNLRGTLGCCLVCFRVECGVVYNRGLQCSSFPLWEVGEFLLPCWSTWNLFWSKLWLTSHWKEDLICGWITPTVLSCSILRGWCYDSIIQECLHFVLVNKLKALEEDLKRSTKQEFGDVGVTKKLDIDWYQVDRYQRDKWRPFQE